MSQSTNNTVAYNAVASDYTSEVGRIQFLIRSALTGVRISIPVKVISVSNAGGLSPIGTVSVQPMVSAVDGDGKLWAHGIIHNVPYMRIQGGSNGIILDPAVGDVGIATVCDRDISTVKNTGAVAAPGSNRKNDLSDMVYLMTIIGAAPTQYIQFNSSGLTIHSPTKVTINAPNVEVDASTACTINAPSIVLNGAVSQGQGSYGGNAVLGGSLTVTGDVTAEGTSLHTHVHGGVQTGSGNTGQPA
jgi:hypothetical protein